ncbi:alpha/beta fold hydrolase [Aureimonas leprariae]|uniref:Alpha/beta hydrolase n=1 Tax=Plantimonas leprariae TaxID=2615207 RepID=A0A7V7U0V5_9HYPH|nr:alpha/beta hydrolase [Aureimonas leprariae]KAB0680949.1 alpha/beta hydrolase [Aureimonas leprariae]
MDVFENDGLRLAFLDEGDPAAPAVLLIHGFASSMRVNWIEPGWVQTLAGAGYRVLAFDHRGHGGSDKPREPAAYTPEKMAGDAHALLARRSVERAALFGYSMGARVAAFAALETPEPFPALVFGGLGDGLVRGVGDWDPIAAALLADSLDDVTHERGRMFRAFADRTRSDRRALAACITTSRRELSPADVGRIAQPTLIGVGTKDDIAGSATELAAMMPNATAFAISGRDHMLAVGDRAFKAEVLRFLANSYVR